MSMETDSDQSKARILVVDDDADFVEIEKKMLESAGYAVETAYSGQECIQQIKERSPDLLLLDIAMTKPYEGVDVAQFLRDHKETGDIPIIVVTSKPIGSIYPEDMWYPTDEFISKPVDRQELLEKIEKLLKR